MRMLVTLVFGLITLQANADPVVPPGPYFSVSYVGKGYHLDDSGIAIQKACDDAYSQLDEFIDFLEELGISGYYVVTNESTVVNSVVDGVISLEKPGGSGSPQWIAPKPYGYVDLENGYYATCTITVEFYLDDIGPT